MLRRRLHRRFWTYDQAFLAGPLVQEMQGLWSSPSGPIFLRDRPPDWVVECTDWDLQKLSEITIPGSSHRLAYFVRGVTVGDRLYIHGEGDDFGHIYACNGELKEAIQTGPNEALEGAWVQGGVAYGGWSGLLRWSQTTVNLSAPIQEIQAHASGPWVLVKSDRQTLVQVEDGRQRELPGASLAAFMGDALAVVVDGTLCQQELETGQFIDRRPLASPAFGLRWLPGRRQLAILHQDGVLRFYEPGTGLMLWELNPESVLPAIPEVNSLPFNFSGRAQFHSNGRLSYLVGASAQLRLAADHASGKFISGDPQDDYNVEQRYYANGTVEQFSAWDDNSEAHPVPFSDWVQRCLSQIL